MILHWFLSMAMGLAFVSHAVMNARPVTAQKEIELNEHNNLPGVDVDLVLEASRGDRISTHYAKNGLDGVQLNVGDELRLCLESSEDGYATVWYRRKNEKGRVEVRKLLPNGSGAIAVTANQRVCAGSFEEGVHLKVTGPIARAEIIAYWTPTQRDGWPDSADPKPVFWAWSARSPSPDTYSSRTMQFSVVDD